MGHPRDPRSADSSILQFLLTPGLTATDVTQGTSGSSLPREGLQQLQAPGTLSPLSLHSRPAPTQAWAWLEWLGNMPRHGPPGALRRDSQMRIRTALATQPDPYGWGLWCKCHQPFAPAGVDQTPLVLAVLGELTHKLSGAILLQLPDTPPRRGYVWVTGWN